MVGAECSYLVAVPGSEEPQEISEDAWTQLQEQKRPSYPRAEQPQGQKIEKRRYRKAFLGKSAVLDVSDIACFQINWTTGRYDRNRGYHYGVVRPMRDPQMLSNKTLSQVLHILNTNAKGGLIIEKGVFANPRDAEKDWSNPAKTIIVNDGRAGQDQGPHAPAIPPALVQLQEFAVVDPRRDRRQCRDAGPGRPGSAGEPRIPAPPVGDDDPRLAVQRAAALSQAAGQDDARAAEAAASGRAGARADRPAGGACRNMRRR
jgi:hypothetical protein